ncbi:MAG: sialate O-acetylesterase [Terriglobales bacterium]
MMKAPQSLLCGLLLCVCSLPLLADPTLPGLFSDHMVLQQQQAIPIWGWADPAEDIVVSLGAQTQRTVAARDGHWKVILPPRLAGGPWLITVKGKKIVTIKDVMIGEVWVLSGQSNMSFALSGAEGGEAAIQKADYPQIRMFTVPQQSTLEPQQTIGAQWKPCTPETVKDFSAVGYFFGRELYHKLGVPIGLIHSSWPGTGAEDWSTPQSLSSDPELAPILQHWQQQPPERRHELAEAADFQLEFDDFQLVKADSASPEDFSNFDDGSSRISNGGYWTYSWDTAPKFVLSLVQPGRGGSGYAAQVSGQLATADTALLKAGFRSDGAPADMSSYAGIRFYCRGRGYFRLRSLQPTVTDWDDYSTAAFEASSEWKPVTIWFKDLKQEGWGVPLPFTQQSLSGFAIEMVRAPGFDELPPAALFNGMIAPLIPYTIRGVVWYQGERNAPRAYQYRRLLPALIQGWRNAWGEGDFQFLIVQLPNYGGSQPIPGEKDWAELREAQLMALHLPNTGLAVTIDLGEANNLHPHKKAEVGQRLALWALGTTYGRDVVYSGPLYDSMKIESNRIRIHFKQVGSGLEARASNLRGFTVAGADRVFHFADAVIDGDTIVLSSPDVSAPVAVRYAWAGNPDCNLYNKDGLPASPFRTDDWPGITDKQK